MQLITMIDRLMEIGNWIQSDWVKEILIIMMDNHLNTTLNTSQSITLNLHPFVAPQKLV